MQAIEGQDDHNDEVRDEQPEVECADAVEVLEGLVGEVRAPIVGQALGSQEDRGERKRSCVEKAGQNSYSRTR
jgi:hypothetical protein